MTGPALAARCLAAAILLGAVAGIAYGFLRPVRPRWLGDGLFVCILSWLWVYLGFGVCQGDLRLGYTAGLFLGAMGFHCLFGRGLLPVFSWFWEGLYAAFSFFFTGFKKFFKKLQISSFHRSKNRVE